MKVGEGSLIVSSSANADKVFNERSVLEQIFSVKNCVSTIQNKMYNYFFYLLDIQSDTMWMDIEKQRRSIALLCNNNS